MTETFVKERKHTLTGKVREGRHRRRRAFLGRFANGSLGIFESTRYARGHKALYTFEINGENGSLQVGPARPAPPAVVRPPRRGHAARLDVDPRHRRRPPLHGQVVGAGPADRLRAHLRPPGRRLPRRPARPASRPSPTFRDALETTEGLRRDHRVGQDGEVGEGDIRKVCAAATRLRRGGNGPADGRPSPAEASRKRGRARALPDPATVFRIARL